MAETVIHLDSFDHYDPAWTGAKYTRVFGTRTHVAGPYGGSAVRFGAPGCWIGPAIVNQSMSSASTGQLWSWVSGAFSAHVRVSGTGWASGGELCLLAPTHYQPDIGEGTDYPHHWLTVAEDGTLRVRTWTATTGTATSVLAASSAGAFPLDAWCFLEYRTVVGGANIWDLPTTGSVGAQVDGADVLGATGLVTKSVRSTNSTWCRYFKFGSLDAATAGVEGLGAGAPTASADFDDTASRMQDGSRSGVGYGDVIPFRGRHRVAALAPTGPGSLTGLSVVGAAANWQAVAEAPPDGDTSYVSKAAGVANARDLYATAAAPTIDEGAAGATLWIWGLSSTTQEFSPFITQRYLDGTATARTRSTGGSLTYRYYAIPLYTESPGAFPVVTGLTNARLAGLQIGWGGTEAESAGATDAQYRATQQVAELWQGEPEPPPEPPEPSGGGARWSVGWVP